MAYQTITNLGNILKETWGSDTISQIVLDSTDVFLGTIKKEKFTGGIKKFPILSQRTTDAGDFDFSQTFTGGATYLQWQIDPASDFVKGYNCVSRNGDALYLAKDNMNMFLADLATEMKHAFEKISQTMNIQSYLGVDPVIGVIDSTTTLSGTSLVLTNADDIVNFEIGDRIQVLDTSNSDALLDSTDWLVVEGKDVSTATLTVDAAISGISGVATGDKLIKAGYNDDGFYGLSSWLPTSTPSSTAFFNIDRSVDRLAYAGSPLNATGLNVTEAILNLASNMYKYTRTSANGQYKCIMNQSELFRLHEELRAKSYFVKDVTASYNWGGKVVEGVQGIGIQTAVGTVECYAGKFCPVNYGYMINPSDWTLYYIGDNAPMILDADGLQFRAMSTDDAWEARIGFYAQTFCKDIQKQGVLYNLGA